jgi:hypothetical protein
MFNSIEVFLLFHLVLFVHYFELKDLYQNLIVIYVNSNEVYQLMIQTNHLIDQIDI